LTNQRDGKSASGKKQRKRERKRLRVPGTTHKNEERILTADLRVRWSEDGKQFKNRRHSVPF